MTARPTSSAAPGFGLGLRTPHYADFLAGRQPVDWLEVITDNFLVDGGKPLAMLETFRRDYPIALHGVAMSLGSAQGLNLDYLRRVKQLADRMDAMWVSDHLCWTGPAGQSLHDLYPLPYTEECARLLVKHIRLAQDVLERRLVIENVSSYLRFSTSGVSEWDFLAHVVHEADCELLVDVNNIYVSSVNHGFDPAEYLRALPAQRVRQIHLAGHSRSGDFIIDTHDQPVCPEVWALYAQACRLYGPTATMIERDDHIPPLPVLLVELQQARDLAAAHGAATPEATSVHPAPTVSTAGNPPALAPLQQLLGSLVLGPQPDTTPAVLGSAGPLPALRGLAIYHNAYRARLVEVLADHFAKTVSYVGGDTFDELARGYVETHTPNGQHLGSYGDEFAAHLEQIYPDHPVLRELADLEWALRTVFDASDQPAWNVDSIQRLGAASCLTQWPVLHPTVRFLRQRTNAMAIWKAIADDVEVPEVQRRQSPGCVIVWRRGLTPHFSSLEADEAEFLQALESPQCNIAKVAETQMSMQRLSDPAALGRWLHQWWTQELLWARP